MPPTVQTNEEAVEKQRTQKPVEKRSDLICRVKYCNTLPDIPFDLKFITYPFEATRFIQFNPTSLERNYRYDVLTEHDLGVTIDLINKDIYAVESGAVLDPADEKLLEEDVLTPQDSKRSRHHAQSVSWLRRTEYISTEQTRFQPQTMDKVEAKVGYSIKKNLNNETLLYMDRESQIKAIERTFQDAENIKIEKHYSKPNVTAVEVLPVFPDFKLWKYPCAQVIFDTDPAPTGKQVPAQIEEMSQAMIRGVMDESGEQFVAYFLPTEDTLAKRRDDAAHDRPYQDDVEYEYKMAREYNWNVKSKASKGYEENYFFVLRQDGAYYNELETRVRLSKRRQKLGQQQTANTRLVVRHRPMDANEFRMQRYREKQLEPVADEDEEADEQEDDIDDDATGAATGNSQTTENGAEENENDETHGGRNDRTKDDHDDNQSETSERSGERGGGSRSVSRSRSRSRSASAASGSRSRSGTPRVRSSRSRSRSGSESGSLSGSVSGSGSRSRSGSASSPDSNASDRSRSQSPSGSESN